MKDKDRNGVPIDFFVGQLDFDKTVKVARYSIYDVFPQNATATEKAATLVNLSRGYVRQARALARAALNTNTTTRDAARMLGKAAYAMRQAVRVEFDLRYIDGGKQ